MIIQNQEPMTIPGSVASEPIRWTRSVVPNLPCTEGDPLGDPEELIGQGERPPEQSLCYKLRLYSSTSNNQPGVRPPGHRRGGNQHTMATGRDTFLDLLNRRVARGE
jgi:hypothetical protein